MIAPTLLTERLKLSHPSQADFEPFAALWQNETVVRFIGGQKRERQDAWLTLMRQAGYWSVLGYGCWTVRRRSDDTYLGEVGFMDSLRGMDPDISGRPEASWVLDEPYWGQGYASEALKATHTWLDQEIPGRSTCIIEPDHSASIRVAQKLGYVDFAASDYRGKAMLIFERYTSTTQRG